MTINYGVKERKPFVNLIGKFIGEKPIYQKTPTYAYKIGKYCVDKNGDLIVESAEKELDELIAFLNENGYQIKANTSETVGVKEPIQSESETDTTEQKQTNTSETVGVTIALPRDSFSENSLINLQNLVNSKAELIKKSLGVSSLPIDISDEKISFPWFDENTENTNVPYYTLLISNLCNLARKQKRINSIEKVVENEKYAFRCFLLRLGFIGDNFKNARKVLLKNFVGNSAFKNGGANNEIS